jgi:hypothetical protein
MSFTGKSLLEALKTDSLHEAIVLVGLVKKSDDDPNVVLFDPTLLCTRQWIKIPADLIAKADVLGKLPCKDHVHDLVRLEFKEPNLIEKVQPLGKRQCRDDMHDYVILYFKQPGSPEAAVFAELLQHSAAVRSTDASGSLASRSGQIWKACYYEPGTGQYAGSSLHFDKAAAERFCLNYAELHHGACNVRPIDDPCPM